MCIPEFGEAQKLVHCYYKHLWNRLDIDDKTDFPTDSLEQCFIYCYETSKKHFASGQ